MDATPSVALPGDAESGVVTRPPVPLQIGPRRFEWGARTYVMGIINVTPDSFSGDGLLAKTGGSSTARDAPSLALRQALRMSAAGADLLDVGGQSTRPGHQAIDVQEELARVLPVVRAISGELPDVPLSIDTTRAEVAAAALEAGARVVNDVWGVAADDGLLHVAAAADAPLVLMHNRREARYRNVVAEVVADLSRALDRALAAGCAWESLIVDPGIGFGKTADQNLAVLHDLALLTALGRPVLLGTSRKSTIGKVLDLPAAERLEGTLATTALGIAAGVDIVRVHDVEPNVRVARMADAIVRGGWTEAGET
jgi:dihydropteroate synthase